jgi:UDP-N-acetylmuramate--alanine ligase
MNFDQLKSIYFLGIGGIGMSALARYFKTLNKNVCGYDKTQTALTDELIHEGMQVHFEDSISFFKEKIQDKKEEILIVLTPAIPKDHKELIFFIEQGYTIKKRAEVLGLITQNTFTLAVAGTHGKTTTSSILAHLLKSAQKDCSAFLGGITRNYNSNFILSSHKNGLGPTVVEADEYDRSFLTLHPNITIITSVDADHLDIYSEHKYLKESFLLYAAQIKENGFLISKKGLDLTFPKSSHHKNYTYALSEEADFYAKNIRIEAGCYVFDLVSKVENCKDIFFSFPGIHNTENAIAAIAAAQLFGLNSDEIKLGLSTFKGVKRRFDFRIKNEKLLFIDDYAHHPEELKACIGSVKELYPTKQITGIFQPHLYTRTRDFANEFAESLDLLDETLLLDIYPARELPIEGVHSQMLLDLMKGKQKTLCSKAQLIENVLSKNREIVLTLGAGDIDKLVEPLELALRNKYSIES